MELIRIAASALTRHKLRSFLTLLGVIIGVMTVISVVSVISGLNAYIKDKVFQLSPDVFIVTKFGIITSREEFIAAARRRNLDERDLQLIRTGCGDCGVVGASTDTHFTVRSGDRKLLGVDTTGGTTNIAELNNLDLEEGRFYVESEEEKSAPVAIIGSDVRDELFAKRDPIGRTITVSGFPLRVIGLLRKQGSVLGQSQDSVVYLPLSTYKKHFGSRNSLDITVRSAGGVERMGVAEDEIRALLRSRRRTAFRADDPFDMVTAEALQILWKNISNGAFALMTIISGIALVVGGIVITNIMLVSVVERTREIGIRRAMGARKKDILRQFLIEAILLAGVGGVIGVLLGFGISQIINLVFLPTRVEVWLIATGLGIAFLTGLTAGFFPAKRAANLRPVEALRWE